MQTEMTAEQPRQGNEGLVRLTEAAGQKAEALMHQEDSGTYLRAAVSGGGCNGLSYKLKFVPQPKTGDILILTAGIQVLVDSKSALYLRGTVIDYANTMVGGGFKFDNPNAEGSCSCGDSFNI